MHAVEDGARGVADGAEEVQLFEVILGQVLESAIEDFGKVGAHLGGDRLARRDVVEKDSAFLAAASDLAEHPGQVQLPGGDGRGDGGEQECLACLHGGILDSGGGHVLPVRLGEESDQERANAGDGDVLGDRRRVGDRCPETLERIEVVHSVNEGFGGGQVIDEHSRRLGILE